MFYQCEFYFCVKTKKSDVFEFNYLYLSLVMWTVGGSNVILKSV